MLDISPEFQHCMGWGADMNFEKDNSAFSNSMHAMMQVSQGILSIIIVPVQYREYKNGPFINENQTHFFRKWFLNNKRARH